jgi:hypothetical protein
VLSPRPTRLRGALRRIGVALLGGSLVVLGVAMLVLPGPAFLVIPLGLGVLGAEFAWARRWLAALRRRSGAAARSWRRRWAAAARRGRAKVVG